MNNKVVCDLCGWEGVRKVRLPKLCPHCETGSVKWVVYEQPRDGKFHFGGYVGLDGNVYPPK
jgi:hypothetical protein